MDSQPSPALEPGDCEDTQIEGDPPVQVLQDQNMDMDQAEIDGWTDRQPDDPDWGRTPCDADDGPVLTPKAGAVDSEVEALAENFGKGVSLQEDREDFSPEQKKMDLHQSVGAEEAEAARIKALEKQLANVRALQQALNLGSRRGVHALLSKTVMSHASGFVLMSCCSGSRGVISPSLLQRRLLLLMTASLHTKEMMQTPSSWSPPRLSLRQLASERSLRCHLMSQQGLRCLAKILSPCNFQISLN